MGHVERVEISGFKCLSAVDFDCGQFNVLTGRNGTGKTSILEAIQLAHDPTALENFNPAVGRLIEIKKSTANMELERSDDLLQFSMERVDSATALPLVSEAAVDNLLVVYDSGDISQPFEETDGSSDILTDFEQYLSQSDSSLYNLVVKTDRGGYTQEFVSRRQDIGRNFRDFSNQIDSFNEDDIIDMVITNAGHGFTDAPPASEPIDLIEPANQSDQGTDADSELRRVRVREFLRDHDILPNLESFSFDELVFDEDGEQYAIPYDFLGEGTKTITSLVWQLLSEEEIPDVILLEEPENHLHPGYVKELVEFLIEFARDEDVQLFVTTHNVDFLREFFNDATVGDHEAWLGEEFRLIQTTELSPKQFDYERAREHVEELQLDLRGL